MNNETYERVELDITPFDAEDVIATSGVIPGFTPEEYEMISNNMI